MADANKTGTSNIRISPVDLQPDPDGNLYRLNRKFDLIESQIENVKASTASQIQSAVANAPPGPQGETGPAGPAGSAGTPAPNVTSATAAVLYQPYGHISQFGFTGSFDLPVTDADYSHLVQVEVVAFDPDGNGVDISIVDGPWPTGTTTVTFTGIVGLQPPADQVWTVKFICRNEFGSPTNGPATKTLTVHAAAVASVVGVDAPTLPTTDPNYHPRWKDQGGSVHDVINVTISMANEQYPQDVTIWLNEGGVLHWHAWRTITGDNQIVTLGLDGDSTIVFPPAGADEAWTAIVAPGAISGNSLPSNAFTSAIFTVPAMQPPAATEVTTLVIGAGAGGNFPYNRVLLPDHTQDWDIPSLGWDDTVASNDPDADFATLTAQDLDVNHNPIGIEHKYGSVDIGKPTDNHTRDWGGIAGPYGNVADPPRSGNIAYVRFRLYLSNRRDTSDNAWQNPLASTLQNLNGAGYIDVLVAAGGNNPTSALFDQAAPNIPNATLDSITYQFNSATTIPVFNGTIYLPTTDPNYAAHFNVVIVNVAVPILGPHGAHLTKYVEITRVPKPTDGSTSVSFSGSSGQLIQGPSDQTGWSLQFVCYNESFVPTTNPFQIPNVTIPAGTITALSATDNTAARWKDSSSALHAVIPVAITCSDYPQYVTIWTNSPQYGRICHGVFAVQQAGSIYIGAQNSNTTIFPPTLAASENVTVYVAIGSFDGTVDPTTVPGVQTTTVSVSGPGVFSSTVSSGGGTAGAYITNLQYYAGPGGANYWQVTILFFLPLSLTNFKFGRLTVQTGYYGSGGVFVPEGPQATETNVCDWAGPTPTAYDRVDHDPNLSLVSTLANGQIQGLLGQWPVPSTRDVVFRWRLYVASSADDGTGATKVLQTTWSAGYGISTPGTAAYQDVVVDGTKSQTDPRYTLPNSWGSGIGGGGGTAPYVNAGSGLTTTGGALALKYGSALADDGTGAVTVLASGPLYKDISNRLNMQMSSDFVVSGGALTQAAVNLMKAYGFDSSIFGGGGGGSALTINALGVNKLVAGTALFYGTATFVYTSTGPYVQVGAAGAVFGDAWPTPTATVTVASGGATIARGSSSVQVTSAGVGIYGPSGSLTATSGGIAITNGSSSVTVQASGVSIVNGSLTSPTISGGSISGTSLSILTSNGTVSVSTSNPGVYVSTSISNYSYLSAAGLVMYNGSASVNISPSSATFGGSMTVGLNATFSSTSTFYGQATFYGGISVNGTLSCQGVSASGYTSNFGTVYTNSLYVNGTQITGSSSGTHSISDIYYPSRSSNIGPVNFNGLSAGRYLISIYVSPTGGAVGTTLQWQFYWNSGGVLKSITGANFSLNNFVGSGFMAEYVVNVDGGTGFTYQTFTNGVGSYEFSFTITQL